MSIKLFKKLMTRFEHYICTNFGISEESHGGRHDPLGGLGQGIMISGSSNRGMSSFIFKALEDKGVGFRNAC